MNGPHPAGGFGPWTAGDLSPIERAAQLRLLAGVAACFVGSANPVVTTLRRAEHDDDAKAQALALLNGIPSLTRRKIISTFGAVMWAPTRRGGRS
jgi:hypothetical protein